MGPSLIYQFTGMAFDLWPVQGGVVRYYADSAHKLLWNWSETDLNGDLEKDSELLWKRTEIKLELFWKWTQVELEKSPRKSSQMLWNYLVIALKPPCNHLVTPFALGLLGNCSENSLQSNPRERVAKLSWNYSEIAPKLIQNYSETPPNLFQNCSRTALKTFPGKCTNIAPKLLQNCNNC